MFALLNPRVWITLALCAVLAFSHFTAYRFGKGVVRAEWDKDIAKRTALALQAEQAARQREQELVAAKQVSEERYVEEVQKAESFAAGARSELGRLRNAIAARNRASTQSTAACPAADAGARSERDLLGTCAETLVGVAADADQLGAKVIGLQQYVSNVCLRQ